MRGRRCQVCDVAPCACRCRHCGLRERSPKASAGLCWPCYAYRRKYGELPSYHVRWKRGKRDIMAEIERRARQCA